MTLGEELQRIQYLAAKAKEDEKNKILGDWWTTLVKNLKESADRDRNEFTFFPPNPQSRYNIDLNQLVHALCDKLNASGVLAVYGGGGRGIPTIKVTWPKREPT